MFSIAVKDFSKYSGPAGGNYYILFKLLLFVTVVLFPINYPVAEEGKYGSFGYMMIYQLLLWATCQLTQ